MKTFLNLTNGLLFNGSFDGFIRIQSCHCERKCWNKVMLGIDNNFLMWVALGYDVQVVDYSAKKQVPRALYQGLEFVWYAICKSWKLQPDVSVRGVNCAEYFEEEWKKLHDDVKDKLKYFRKFLNNPKKPTIIAGQTDKDGNYEFFTNLVKEKFHPPEFQPLVCADGSLEKTADALKEFIYKIP